MSKVNGAKKLTDNSFLNLYELDAETNEMFSYSMIVVIHLLFYLFFHYIHEIIY